MHIGGPDPPREGQWVSGLLKKGRGVDIMLSTKDCACGRTVKGKNGNGKKANRKNDNRSVEFLQFQILVCL